MSDKQEFWATLDPDAFMAAYILSLMTEASLEELMTYQVCDECKTIVFNYDEFLCPRCEEHFDCEPGYLIKRVYSE